MLSCFLLCGLLLSNAAHRGRVCEIVSFHVDGISREKMKSLKCKWRYKNKTINNPLRDLRSTLSISGFFKFYFSALIFIFYTDSDLSVYEMRVFAYYLKWKKIELQKNKLRAIKFPKLSIIFLDHGQEFIGHHCLVKHQCLVKHMMVYPFSILRTKPTIYYRRLWLTLRDYFMFRNCIRSEVTCEYFWESRYTNESEMSLSTATDILEICFLFEMNRGLSVNDMTEES